jgi:hypothetical protein
MQNITRSSGSLSFTASSQFVVAAVSVAAAMACGGALAQGKAGTATTEAYAAGRILVMPRAGLPDAALGKVLTENGAGRARRIGRTDLRIVELPAGVTARTMVERLKRHPHVKFAELDRRVALSGVSNDPYLGSQWHVPKIGATTAWDRALGAGIKIAIIDTGVDGTHPDLVGRMLPGWNFHDGNSNAADVQGHGTAVAGTAAATVNNGAGVAGIAGQAQIIPVRISAPDGYAYWSTIAQGLTWAADNGAKVANISYAVTGSSSVQSAANYMRSKGGLVVVSAGNNGVNETVAPTSTMVTVSATTSSDTRASWSSYGNFVTIAAPGDSIWTTNRGGGYGSWSGTSFASPVTAGVVGLMMAANPSLPPADVERLLYSSAVDLGVAGRDIEFGWGRVDAAAAVLAAAQAVSSADTQPPAVAIGAPLGSATVGGLVPVDVSASDNKGVAKVDLRVNGVTVASDTNAPFAFSWDSTKVANGVTSLAAVAVDGAGNAATSATVSVNVANTVVVDSTAPVVTVTNPADGSRVSGVVGIRVSASDNAGTAGLKQTLLINGKTVATATGGSLSYSWNTRKVAAGSYRIEAVARDATGNSATRAVNVNR